LNESGKLSREDSQKHLMFMNLLEDSKKMLYDIKVMDDNNLQDIEIIKADMN